MTELERRVRVILDDLRETLSADEVTDPIGYLETLELRLADALGEERS